MSDHTLTEDEAKVLWRESALRMDAIENERIAAASRDPKQLPTLGKIGYVLKAMATGMQQGQARSEPVEMQTIEKRIALPEPQTPKLQTYFINGTTITCSHTGSLVNCY